MLRRSFVIASHSAVSALVCAPTFAQGQSAPAQAPLTADQIVDRVQAFYDKTKVFKSSFKQRYSVKAYAKTKDSTGEVIFEKPGKMSWRYTNNGNRVVSDGKLIKVYEKDNKQMYEQPLDKSQYPAALAFLTGGGKLKDSFTWERADAKQMGFEGGFVLVGTPKEATPAYQKIFLYVDGATYQVRRVLLLDAQGNKNRFDFVKPQVNSKAPPGEFNFTPPPGTQVIRP
ncbi:MAG TPA: outer membrane lipoprotein carrier protein LolA [Polyangiaceae bacterium]|nr:outer membrane lipoprotein carrier protein LolA [Polyangiaceae bacterium]